MGEMRDSDWSRENLLRSDWLGLIGAIMTTNACAKFGVNKVHYGRCASGVLSPFEFICSWKIGNKITQEL